MLTRLLNLFRPSPTESAPPSDEFTLAIKAYAKGLPSTQGRDIEAEPIEQQAGLVLLDIALRALTASGHQAQAQEVEEQIALLMFALLVSSPLVMHLRNEGHDIQHGSLFGVAAAGLTSNLDDEARKQIIELSSALFKRFIEQAREKEQFDTWLETNRHLVWGLVIGDKPELRQALAGHYIAMRAAVAQLR